MKNIHLNPGGLIGAIAVLAIVIVATVLTGPENIGRHMGRFVVIGALFGAVGGNFF